jgi:2-(1,2-epoxy-1,2-dihydrophenyl)acetyl-CoA isomerase
MNACDLVVASDDAYFASAYRQIARRPTAEARGRCRVWSACARRWRSFSSASASTRKTRSPSASSTKSCRAELDAATAALAGAIATVPAQALRNTKRLVRESVARTLSEQLQAEAVSFSECAANADFVEGITAFLAKRAPQFGRE